MPKHHRKPKAQKGRGGKNLVEVDEERHILWHKLFPGHVSIRNIAKELNTVWIHPDYYLVLRKRRRKK